MDFCVSFILSENDCHIKYVIDPLMGVMNIYWWGWGMRFVFLFYVPSSTFVRFRGRFLILSASVVIWPRKIAISS